MPTNPDERRHAWLGIAAVAIVAMAAIGWRSLSASPKLAVEATPAGANVGDVLDYLSASSDSVAPTSSLLSGTARAADFALTRDPFGNPSIRAFAGRRGNGSATGTSHWTVNAVLITPSYRAAIINDVLVHLGGQLSDGTRLTAVEHDHVVLTDARGTRRTIDVKERA